MKIKLFAFITLVAGLAVASGTPEKEEGRKDRGKPGFKQLLEKFDANKDGKLDKEERKLLVAYRKAEFMKRFDKNGDGKICDKEKKAAAEAMKDRRGPGPNGRGPRPGKKKPAKKK
tara:strand:- start:173 stop:520 length:348 start_codon:yes stop_codon:yes gene_type:complete